MTIIFSVMGDFCPVSLLRVYLVCSTVKLYISDVFVVLFVCVCVCVCVHIYIYIYSNFQTGSNFQNGLVHKLFKKEFYHSMYLTLGCICSWDIMCMCMAVDLLPGVGMSPQAGAMFFLLPEDVTGDPGNKTFTWPELCCRGYTATATGHAKEYVGTGTFCMCSNIPM